MRPSSLLPLLLLSALGCAADQDYSSNNDDAADSLGPNRSQQAVSLDDQARIIDMTGEALFTPASLSEASFVIHDTAGATSSSFMASQAQKGRGPLGQGPQVWVASNADTFVARSFFDRARPSSSLHEKVGDLLNSNELAALGRKLWSGVSAEDQDTALADSLADLAQSFPGEAHRMTATEINAEIDNARQLLNGTSGELFTTALWTVQSLVDEGKFGNLSGAEAELIRNYYDTRDERIGNAVNVEVGQISGGNCVGGQALQPYSDDVYDSIATTYLQSALVAGFYPDTTTHFAVDAAHRGHCDPRCFDLNYFYSVVAEKMGHEPGTRYGAAAKYGTRYGVHNIWWDNAVCGGPPRAL